MRKLACLSIVFVSLSLFAQNNYKIISTYHISGPGTWDYLTVNNGKIYVSHGTQVNVLNEATGDSVGVISNTNGVHGIAFDNELGRGYTSNGRSNNVTVFDAKSNAAITQIAVGENPDAILFEPQTKTIITCNGRSRNLSVIDPKTNIVLRTIDVGGKPETAVSDGNGKLFVNLEDKNAIAMIDLKDYHVSQWSLKDAEGPTGLAYDKSTKRLFAGCDKYLVVMNADNGNIVDKLPIGDGCDGVAFDGKNKVVFTSNGVSGNMTAIKENSGDKFSVLGNYPTKRGARTLTIDEATGTLFFPAADYESGTQNGRPRMIPGTFQLLVVK